MTHPLARAFRVTDPAERLALCVERSKSGRTPAALVATASVCMEVNDLEAAARDLDEAIALAPEWAAAHYERGKLWLRVDDMVKASESFQRAAELLPGFAPAWANLGGTLGELDRPERGAGGVRARTRPGSGQPAGPEQHRRGPARARPFERVRGRVPAGHPTHARDGLWPLQSRAYTVFAGAFPGRAVGICRGPGARSGEESGAGVAAGAVQGRDRRCGAARCASCSGRRRGCRANIGGSCSATPARFCGRS